MAVKKAAAYKAAPKMAMPRIQFGALGYWAFLLGVVIAIIVGLAVAAGSVHDKNTRDILGAVLVLLGAVVGFLNIGDRQSTAFLIAALALMATYSVGFTSWGVEVKTLGFYISQVLGYLATFVAPAASVVAVKKIYDLAKGE